MDLSAGQCAVPLAQASKVLILARGEVQAAMARSRQNYLKTLAAGCESELSGPVSGTLGVSLKATHAQERAIAMHLHSFRSGTTHCHKLSTI